MKKVSLALAALAASTAAAQAGGFERSGLPMGFMFEKGNYAELSFGYVDPGVSGATNAGIPAPVGSGSSGDVAGNYSTIGLAFKMDVNDRISLGFTLDPTYGADVSYPTGNTYPLRGSNATLRGETLAIIGRYKLSDAFSVHAGLRSVNIGGNVSLSTTTIPGAIGTPVNYYAASFSRDNDVGYLVGAAFEKPEIALRAALTYYSGTSHTLDVAGSAAGVGAFTASTDVELPQSVTLDFQSGVAKDTLVFGSVRWAEWTVTRLDAPNAGAANPLVSYDDDVFTYSLGVGRRFNENWSAAVSLGYEKSNGGIASNLSPTDGYKSIQLGATYTKGNMKISGGVRYVDIGDAVSLSGGSNFTGNSAVAVGFKVGFNF